MELNKLLCKYLDDDKKGYVTLGDVFKNMLFVGVIIGIIIMFGYCIFQVIVRILNKTTILEISKFNLVCTEIGVGIIIAICITIIFLIVLYLSNIKIAKCNYNR